MLSSPRSSLKSSPRRSTTQEIASLQKQKQEAIERLDWKEARRLEEEIRGQQANNKKTTEEELAQQLDKQVRTIHEKVEKMKKKIVSDYEEKEKEIRVSVDEAFRDIQARHIDDLVRFEKTYSVEKLKERNRPVKVELDLKRQAKQLAQANNFDQAEYLTDKAEKERANEIKKRDAMVDEKYNGLREQLFRKQRHEILVLNEKLNQALQQLEQARDTELQKKQKSFEVSSLAELQRCVNQGVSAGGTQKEKQALTAFLKNQLNTTLEDLKPK